MLDKMSMKGKVAIVTGASRGIGKEIVFGLASLGCDVALVSRKQEMLDQVAQEVKDKYDVRAFPIACHCGKEDQVQAMVARVSDELGRIDVLINNAATNPHFGLAIDGDTSMFMKILETNVAGYFSVIKAVAPHMDKVGGGAIVNLASIAGFSPMPFIGLYSVSKAAVISLTKLMGKELGPRNIRVNAVAPGLIKTDFSRALWTNETILNEALKDNAIARIGEADEPANVAVFLATPAASYVTGTTFTVDGGASI